MSGGSVIALHHIGACAPPKAAMVLQHMHNENMP
jgi:hypothetical protein